MTYSQYPYVEAFMEQKQASWIAAHVHMYEYFGGVAKILMPDNCRTAVDHNNKSWNDPTDQWYQLKLSKVNFTTSPINFFVD